MKVIKKGLELVRCFFDADRDMLVTFGLFTLPAVFALILMFQVSLHKTIVIADTETPIVHEEPEAAFPNYPLNLSEKSGVTGWDIPLEKNVRAEQISLENHYWERQIVLAIQCSDPDFYRDVVLQGQAGIFSEGVCRVYEDGVMLCFQADRILEYQVSLEEGTLHLTACLPKERYERIFVVDPRDEISLEVAGFLQKTWDDAAVRIYFTRLREEAVYEGEVPAFVEEVEADAYVGLRVCRSDSGADYGITGYYNDQYYLSGFSNSALADALVRGLVMAASNRGVGLYGAEDAVLDELTIPAAIAGIGFTSNERERALLVQPAYQEKLAEGLAEALREACTKDMGD